MKFHDCYGGLWLLAFAAIAGIVDGKDHYHHSERKRSFREESFSPGNEIYGAVFNNVSILKNDFIQKIPAVASPPDENVGRERLRLDIRQNDSGNDLEPTDATLPAEKKAEVDAIGTGSEQSSKKDNVTYTCFCYDFVIEAVLMGLLCLLGLLGNAASVVCLSHDKSRNATPFLLISLAMADTMFLITVFFLRVLSSIHTFGWSLVFVVKTAPYMAKYVYPAALLSQTAAIYLTVLVTLNRFMAVCYPYIASDVCSLRNAKFHVTAVVIFSIIFNIPRFFQVEIVCSGGQLQTSNVSFPTNETLNFLHPSSPPDVDAGMSRRSNQEATDILKELLNSSDETEASTLNSRFHVDEVTCQIQEAEFALHPLYSIVYASVSYCIVMFLVPLVTLSFFNVRLIGALRVARLRREKLMLKRKRVESARNKAATSVQERKNSLCPSTRSQETNLLGKDHTAAPSPPSSVPLVSRSEDDITFMLVVVVMVFVVTQSPALLTQLLYCTLSEYERTCPHVFFFYERLSDLLVVANSSLNFVIYCFCSARFRQILVELIFGKLKQQQQRGNTQGPRSRMELSQCNVSCLGEQEQQQQQQQVVKSNNLTVPTAVER